jgi:hypothetical protein
MLDRFFKFDFAETVEQTRLGCQVDPIRLEVRHFDCESRRGNHVESPAGGGMENDEIPQAVLGIDPLVAGRDEAEDVCGPPELLSGLGIETEHAAELGRDEDFLSDRRGGFGDRFAGGKPPQGHPVGLPNRMEEPVVRRDEDDRAVGRIVGERRKQRWPRCNLGVGLQLVLHLEAIFLLAIDPPDEEVAAIGGPGDIFLALVLPGDQGLNQGPAKGLAGQRRDAFLLKPQALPALHFTLFGDELRSLLLGCGF